MSDLTKRIKTNPFYHGALKILATHNYHLHRPEYGPEGSIDLIVFMDDKNGKETSTKFNFPAKAKHFSFLQWAPGFKRDVVALEQKGFRPPRRQFVPAAPIKEVAPPKPRAVVEAEKVFTPVVKVEPPIPVVDVILIQQLQEHQEFNEGIIDLMPDEDEVMAVMIAVKRRDIKTLTDVIDGTASILRMKPMSEIKKKATPAPPVVSEPKTIRERIIAQIAARGPLKPKELGVKHPSMYLTSAIKAGDLVRVGRGLYDLGPKQKRKA